MNPVHILPTYSSDIHYNILHLRQGLPSDLFLSSFATKILFAYPISCMHATCPEYLTPGSDHSNNS
jgi:hypothetical protein